MPREAWMTKTTYNNEREIRLLILSEHALITTQFSLDPQTDY